MDNTLKIDLNEEYKIKIEKPEELNNSFFRDIYLKAAQATNDIVKESKENLDKREKVFLDQHQEYNNIIAFVGERGTGKSSAMITFAEALLAINESKKNELFIGDELSLLRKQHYEALEVIDPSLFEKGENIFEVVLAQMFSKFERYLKDNRNDHKPDEKRKVLELFEKVYQNLQTIRKNGDKYDGEALETLSKLACGANLRQNFRELIKLFLKYIAPENQSSFLIIPIDDFDLNVSAVTEMTEQIRKYLMIPNVVILMAANLDQLGEAIYKKCALDFHFLKKQNALKEDPKSIAERYISKLIPERRRIFLPAIRIESNVLLLDYNNKVDTIQKLILDEIYLKTGIILTSNSAEPHLIIPESIRELKYFLSFLVTLPYVDVNNIRSSDLSIVEENINSFLRFLNEYISRIYLSKSYQKLIEAFCQAPTNKKNKLVINRIVQKYHEDFLNTNKCKAETDSEALFKIKDYSESSFKVIISKDNKAHNISVGDVISFVNSLILIHDDAEDKRLWMLLKVHYSAMSLLFLLKNQERDLIRLIGGAIYSHDEHLIQREEVNVIGRQVRSNQGQIRYDSREYFKIDYNILKNRKLEQYDLKAISKESREFMMFFISHFGHEEFKRSNDYEYWADYRSVSSNISKAYFGLLYPVISQFLFKPIADIIRSITNTKTKTKFEKEITKYLKDKMTFLPIYSFDLIDQFMSVKNVYYQGFNVKDSFKNIVTGFYNNIVRELRSVDDNNIWKNYVIASFDEHPLIKWLNTNDSDSECLMSELRCEQKQIVPNEILKYELKAFIQKINTTYLRTFRAFRNFIIKSKNNVIPHLYDQLVDSQLVEFLKRIDVSQDSFYELTIDILGESGKEVICSLLEKYLTVLSSIQDVILANGSKELVILLEKTMEVEGDDNKFIGILSFLNDQRVRNIDSINVLVSGEVRNLFTNLLKELLIIKSENTLQKYFNE
ncbi:MAG: hypothetical protein N4A74_01645 [Carboxylicivirga sp.]|jgi:DNA polymerase III delta prime subunit|nr:hypothetical protein [Carboxylicivirga sp.]